MANTIGPAPAPATAQKNSEETNPFWTGVLESAKMEIWHGDQARGLALLTQLATFDGANGNYQFEYRPIDKDTRKLGDSKAIQLYPSLTDRMTAFNLLVEFLAKRTDNGELLVPEALAKVSIRRLLAAGNERAPVFGYSLPSAFNSLKSFELQSMLETDWRKTAAHVQWANAPAKTQEEDFGGAQLGAAASTLQTAIQQYEKAGSRHASIPLSLRFNSTGSKLGKVLGADSINSKNIAAARALLKLLENEQKDDALLLKAGDEFVKKTAFHFNLLVGLAKERGIVAESAAHSYNVNDHIETMVTKNIPPNLPKEALQHLASPGFYALRPDPALSQTQFTAAQSQVSKALEQGKKAWIAYQKAPKQEAKTAAWEEVTRSLTALCSAVRSYLTQPFSEATPADRTKFLVWTMKQADEFISSASGVMPLLKAQNLELADDFADLLPQAKDLKEEAETKAFADATQEFKARWNGGIYETQDVNDANENAVKRVQVTPRESIKSWFADYTQKTQQFETTKAALPQDVQELYTAISSDSEDEAVVETALLATLDQIYKDPAQKAAQIALYRKHKSALHLLHKLELQIENLKSNKNKVGETIQVLTRYFSGETDKYGDVEGVRAQRAEALLLELLGPHMKALKELFTNSEVQEWLKPVRDARAESMDSSERYRDQTRTRESSFASVERRANILILQGQIKEARTLYWHYATSKTAPLNKMKAALTHVQQLDAVLAPLPSAIDSENPDQMKPILTQIQNIKRDAKEALNPAQVMVDYEASEDDDKDSAPLILTRRYTTLADKLREQQKETDEVKTQEAGESAEAWRGRIQSGADITRDVETHLKLLLFKKEKEKELQK